jgi:D-tyrosyl-tRNA(Tyr) deacylase
LRAVLQRVSRASVTVEGELIARIGSGLVVFVGVAKQDGQADIEYTASKIRDVRVFPDGEGRMNRSVGEVGGSVLLISQFTLLGDARRGRRPAFDGAESPEAARRTYGLLAARLEALGLDVQGGRFQAHMHVDLVNDGPVTILLDSRRTF